MEASPAAGSDAYARRQQLLRWWLPVLAYVATIFVLSSQPNLRAPLHFESSDKLVHLLEYAGLSWLLGRALRVTFGWPVAATAALATVALAMATGAADEWWQSHVPGRDSSVFDWCADSTGAVLAQIFDLVFAEDGRPTG